MDDQQTRENSYSENLDVDLLIKDEPIIAESQEGNLLKESSHVTLLRKSRVSANKSLSKVMKNSIKNEVVSMKEEERIEDLKNKIFTKKNYVDCPYEKCIMKIFIDHIEKHLLDHESNSVIVQKKKKMCCFLCVECGCKHKTFYSLSQHIFSHFNSKYHELPKRKIYSQQVNKICYQDVSDSDGECQPNSLLKGITYDQSVIKDRKLKSVLCNTCGKICKDRKHYDMHMKNFHEELSCESCERLFRGNVSLKTHVNRYCGKKYEYNTDTSLHMKRIHKEYKTETKKRLKSICNICGKLLLPSSLQYHMKTHSSTEIHYCNQCDYQSYTKVNVSKHWRRTHSNFKPVNCQICEKVLKNVDTLSRHMRYCHSSTSAEKTYLCAICAKAFKHSKHLTRHQLIHSGEKPYGCTLCDYRTNQRSNVTIHMKSHKKIISKENEPI
ncbi:unnamed protein product [Meganyctiphanes norvegica]|uniref:Protein hunchback n=1 Tax=Meganyctiphanes norvegica TaxID=48144 RepID=A0AAV2QQ91_MEGNR